MYLEKRFEELSKLNDDNKKLFGIWYVLKQQFIQMLDGVTQYFPHFSLHNETHSKTICQQIERFLGKERIDKLSVSDIWLLLMSFYCHDIGMALKYNDIKKFFDNKFEDILKDNSNIKNPDILKAIERIKTFSMNNCKSINNYKQSIQYFNDIRLLIENHFRSSHAERSQIYIVDLMEKINYYGLINIRFIDLLCKICLTHQKDISSIMELPYLSNGLLDDYIHPRFIAGMLCMGDLLDLDTDRFNEFLLETIDPLPESSEVHLHKHKAIKQFLVSPDGIEIKSDTDKDEVNRELKSWTNYIEKCVKFLAINWETIVQEDFDRPPKIIDIKHFKNGNENWSDYLSLAFKIDKNRAIELLQGTNIYESKFDFIREVIQNAIDASLMQLWYELYNEDSNKYNINTRIDEISEEIYKKYPIDISVTLDEKERCIFTIRDRGIGIDREDLKNISNVGSSNTQKKQHILKTMPTWIKPSGAFGLGLQSIFMVTDSFEIISETDNDTAKKMVFESGNYNEGYISVEDYKEYFTRGTELKITINSDKISLKELEISELRALEKSKGFFIIDKIEKYFSIKNDEKQKLYKISFFDINLSSNFNNKIKEKIYENTLANKIKQCGKLDIKNDNFKFSYYDYEQNILCEIDFYKPDSSIKKEDNISCCFIKNPKKDVYYRNTFVTKSNFDFYLDKFYYFFNFSLNILNFEANNLLNINRNSFINTSHILETLNKSISNSLKFCIDKIISEKKSLGKYVIYIYQICIYLNYKIEDFINIYKNSFNNFNYGVFLPFEIENQNHTTSNKPLNYNPLEQQYLTLIELVDNIDNIKFMDEKILKYLPCINDDELNSYMDYNLFFDANRIVSINILKQYFVKYKRYILKCYDVIIFPINIYSWISCDLLIKIETYVKSIILNYYKICNDKDEKNEYNKLFILDSKYNDYINAYYIYLPFTSSNFNILRKKLKNRDIIENNFVDNFITDLKNSEYFKKVINYISQVNKEEIKIIENQMEVFLKQMLDLLFNNDLYKEYIIKLVNSYK